MAKATKKLSAILYSYTKPVNMKWVKKEAKKRGYKSYSAFVDHILTNARTGGAAAQTTDRQVG